MPRYGKSPVRLVIYLGITVVLALGAWWAVTWFSTPHVTVTRAVRGPVVQAFYATGTVRPEREFPIKASTAGTLEKVLVDKGEHVKAGQPLAIINDPALRFAVDRAKAQLEEKKQRADEKTSPVLLEYDARLRSMQEMLGTAQREVDRLARMAETNSASSVDRDRAQDLLQTRIAESESLKAQKQAKLYELLREMSVAQAELDTANWLLEQQTLKAPIDGVILDRPTSRGTRVAVNDIVMRIADTRPSNLVMRAAVDEEDVTKCRIGQTVRMSLYAFVNQPISGKVSKIYDEADQDRRTFEVDVAFDSPIDLLSSGMTGELAFIIAEKAEATVLPSTALQEGAMYVVRNSHLVKVEPKVGLRSFDRIELIEGLEADDRVVVSPVGTLQTGQHVRITEIDPREAAGLSKDKKAEGAAMKGIK